MAVRAEKKQPNNKELAHIFRLMSFCYRYKGKPQQFRAIAYENAARTIEGLKDDISNYAKEKKSLEELNGIGESIAEKIIEYLATGLIKTFEQLQRQIPIELLSLMEISGMGPATVKTLHKKIGINNKDELIKAIEAGKLDRLKGFGAKKIENIKRGLKLYKEGQKRMLLSEALPIATELLEAVRKIQNVKAADIAGSLRRRKETIGDIDIIVATNQKDRRKIVQQFLAFPLIERILSKGETKASVLLKTGIQVDMRLVSGQEYGATLLYFTGSKEHNIALRTIAEKKGYKLNEYGLFNAETNRVIASETEESLYNKLGFSFIPPELRENRGELGKAKNGHLPILVELKDIRGDLHLHSNWSDGANDIETIARNAGKELPEYEYMVVSDHSPSQRVAKGLKVEDFAMQFKEIDSVNEKIGRPFIKKGVEVDILSNGKLDLPDSLLKQFDWVTASIHVGFIHDNTARLLKACESPYVNCIGHPSGRLIGKRESYPVDWGKLFDKAVETGTAIEINCQPDRLDLPDDLVKVAIEKGVTIAIDTDAHSIAQNDFMSLGIGVARRGWCTRKNILNTRSWKEIEKFRNDKRKALLSDVK
jgi:DNA polymerase (family 10)